MPVRNMQFWLGCSLNLARNSHDPTFAQAIVIEHSDERPRKYRFALYDLDTDELVSENELCGEAFVESSRLVQGKPFEVHLTKAGKAVEECSILFNSPYEAV